MNVKLKPGLAIAFKIYFERFRISCREPSDEEKFSNE